MSTHMFIHMSVRMPVRMSACMSVHMSILMFMHMSTHLPMPHTSCDAADTTVSADDTSTHMPDMCTRHVCHTCIDSCTVKLHRHAIQTCVPNICVHMFICAHEPVRACTCVRACVEGKNKYGEGEQGGWQRRMPPWTDTSCTHVYRYEYRHVCIYVDRHAWRHARKHMYGHACGQACGHMHTRMS